MHIRASLNEEIMRVCAYARDTQKVFIIYRKSDFIFEEVIWGSPFVKNQGSPSNLLIFNDSIQKKDVYKWGLQIFSIVVYLNYNQTELKQTGGSEYKKLATQDNISYLVF